jgi:hypothetical protein
LKPGNGVSVGRAVSVIVSPIFASATFLMLAVRNPASPTPSDSTGIGFGVNTPSCSTSNSCPVCMRRILRPGFKLPSITRARITTPR